MLLNYYRWYPNWEPLVSNWVLIGLPQFTYPITKLRPSTRQHTTRTCLEECSVTEENVLSVEYNDSTSIPSWMGYRIFNIRVNQRFDLTN